MDTRRALLRYAALAVASPFLSATPATRPLPVIYGSTRTFPLRPHEDEMELLVLDRADSEGDIISGEHFPDVNGILLSMHLRFSLEPLGTAVLRRDGDRIMARPRFGGNKRPDYPFELAAGMVTAAAIGPRIEGTARIVHISSLVSVGVVPEGEKIK